jgi:FixJ family two-component response regulator
MTHKEGLLLEKSIEPMEIARLYPRGVVLHVDDDYESRCATGLVLKVAGFDAREAESADAALAQADALRNVLDVLIVDFHLGGETTGTEVAESLARLLGHGMPTIILTGDPANAEIPWLRNSPIWLARKPLCPATLIAGLDALVAFQRAMKRMARA